MSTGKTVVDLSAELAAGLITQKVIEEMYGPGILAAVLGIAGAGLTHMALDTLDRHTGVVSEVYGVVDDVIDTFKFW